MLRNTWGEKSFNGDWSEHSPLWDQVPKELIPDEGRGDDAQGIFWMSEDDFLRFVFSVSFAELTAL